MENIFQILAGLKIPNNPTNPTTSACLHAQRTTTEFSQKVFEEVVDCRIFFRNPSSHRATPHFHHNIITTHKFVTASAQLPNTVQSVVPRVYLLVSDLLARATYPDSRVYHKLTRPTTLYEYRRQEKFCAVQQEGQAQSNDTKCGTGHELEQAMSTCSFDSGSRRGQGCRW